MECYKHNEREAKGRCVRCHKILCGDCIVPINNKVYCKECVSEIITKNININETRLFEEKKIEENRNNTNENNDLKQEENETVKVIKQYNSESNKEEVFAESIKQNENYYNSNNDNKATDTNSIKNIKLVLGIIAVLFAVPRLFNNLYGMAYVFEDIIYTLRYHGAFKFILYVCILLINIILPIAIVVMAIGLIISFNKINKAIRILLPIVIVMSMLLLKFMLGSFIFSYFSYNILSEILIYIVPVILIIIGNAIGE